MCLSNRIEVNIPELKTYKVFQLSNGLLCSPFGFEYNGGRFGRFKINEIISCNNNLQNNFFSFRYYEDAIDLLKRKHYSYWDILPRGLIVLPVTIYYIRVKGMMTWESNGNEYTKTCYQAYESYQLKIHVNENEDLYEMSRLQYLL